MKRKIGLILAASLIVSLAFPAFAEGSGETKKSSKYADEISICGITLESGKCIDVNGEIEPYEEDYLDNYDDNGNQVIAAYKGGTLILNGFCMDADGDLIESYGPGYDAGGGPGSGPGLQKGPDTSTEDKVQSEIVKNTDKKSKFDPHKGINAFEHDLNIVLYDCSNNSICLSSPSEAGITCRNLEIKGDGSLQVSNDDEEHNAYSAIECSGSFFSDGSTLELLGFKHGIVCGDFIVEQGEDYTELDINIESEESGIICKTFTLYTYDYCSIKITLGSEATGIYSEGNVKIRDQGSSQDGTIRIGSALTGIESNTGTIEITSGEIYIEGASGLALKAKEKIILDTQVDREDWIVLNIDTGGDAISASEVDIEDGEIEISAGENGIVATDKIVVNGGEVVIDSGDTALLCSGKEGTITIGPDMTIYNDEEREEILPEYDGGSHVELVYCAMDERIVPVPGKAPTVNSYGWKSYFKCEECRRNFEDINHEKPIQNLAQWKAGAGRIDKLKPEEPEKPEKPVIPPKSSGSSQKTNTPANTGTPGNPVKLGEGKWTVNEKNEWSFETNASFKNTWGFIELPPAIEGEPPKASWFFFDDKGKMLVGWNKIGEFWYYMSEEPGQTYGACQIGGVTKDGYVLGENGAWTGERI